MLLLLNPIPSMKSWTFQLLTIIKSKFYKDYNKRFKQSVIRANSHLRNISSKCIPKFLFIKSFLKSNNSEKAFKHSSFHSGYRLNSHFLHSNTYNYTIITTTILFKSFLSYLFGQSQLESKAHVMQITRYSNYVWLYFLQYYYLTDLYNSEHISFQK